jgi:signal peptidase II
MQYRFKQSYLIVIISLIVALDQITKYIIKTNMALYESFSVIGNFFKITYIENPGMAFGIRISNEWLFAGLSIFAAVMVFYYLFKLRTENWVLQLALCLISSGAIGNLWDRFTRGQVVDFLDFEFWDINIQPFTIFGYHFSGYEMTRWPIFNVADISVSTGMIILMGYLFIVGDPLAHIQKKPAQS